MTQTFAILPAGARALWYVPTRAGYAVLVSPDAAEAMVRAIQQIAPPRDPEGE